MGKRVLSFGCLVFSCWVAWGQPAVPPPRAATQAEVNAGTATRPYVSPATLAGLGGLYATSGITAVQWTQAFNANIPTATVALADQARSATNATTATNALGLVTNTVIQIGGSNLMTLITTATPSVTNVPSQSEVVVAANAGTSISGRYKFFLGDATFQVWTNTASTNLLTFGDPAIVGVMGPWVLTPLTNTVDVWYEGSFNSNSLSIQTFSQVNGPNGIASVGWTTNSITNYIGKFTLGQNATLDVPGGIVGLASSNAYVVPGTGSDNNGWHPGIDRPYATISGAISNAPAGSTIYVGPGRYTEVGNSILSSPAGLVGTNVISLPVGVSIIGAGRELTHINVPIIIVQAGGLLKDFSTSATIRMSDSGGARIENIDGVLRPGKGDGVAVYGSWGSNTIANSTFYSVFRGLEIEDAVDFPLLGSESEASTNALFTLVNTWFFVQFTNNNDGKYYLALGASTGSVSNYTVGVDFEQYGRGRLRMLGGGIAVSGGVTNWNVLVGCTNSWVDLYNVGLRFPRNDKSKAVSYADWSLGVGKAPFTNTVTLYGGSLNSTQVLGGIVTVDTP